MLHVSQLTAVATEQALALEDVLQQILARRPDLQREALLAALVAQAQATPHSLQVWAEHCLGRVRRGEPLPWASGESAQDRAQTEAELISGFLAEARKRAQELHAAGEQLARLRNGVTRNA